MLTMGVENLHTQEYKISEKSQLLEVNLIKKTVYKACRFYVSCAFFSVCFLLNNGHMSYIPVRDKTCISETIQSHVFVSILGICSV